jgi:hypothetical protein
MRPAVFACLLLLTACSLTRESNPPRTATEELLISTAIDRAVEGLKLDIPKSTSVYLDASNFEGTDSKYAVSSIAERVLLVGGRLTSDRSKADMVVAVRSGALSTDSDGFLVGLPAMGVPVPLAGTLSTPEVALLKRAETRGVAKFAATVYDAKTGALKSVSGASYGFSHRTHWVVLLVGWTREDAIPRSVDPESIRPQSVPAPSPRRSTAAILPRTALTARPRSLERASIWHRLARRAGDRRRQEACGEAEEGWRG